MSRQLTEPEWKLIAGVMGWKAGIAYPDSLIRCNSCERFRPLRDHADLARLVEAMLENGYDIDRYHHHDVKPQYLTTVKHEKYLIGSGHEAPTDLEATCFACVEALKEKEKRDATDTDG